MGQSTVPPVVTSGNRIMPESTPIHTLSGKALTGALDFRALPKVLLHEHLDGGVRPTTVIELAEDIGYTGLPTSDPLALSGRRRI